MPNPIFPEYQDGIKPHYKVIETLDELIEHFEKIIASGTPWSADIETGYLGEDHKGLSLHPETNMLVGFSFCYSYMESFYVPLAHDMYDGNLSPSEVAPLLWNVLNRGKSFWHNAKFDTRTLAWFFRKHLWDHPLYAEQVRADSGYFPLLGDTFLMAYCVADDQKFGLKLTVKTLYGHTMTELVDLFPGLAKNKQSYLRFNKLEISKEVYEYVCEDAYWTFRLFYDLPKLLLRSKDDAYTRRANFDKIYALEMKTLRSVCAMEDYGIAVDWGMLKQAAVEGSQFKDVLNAEIQEELTELLGEPIDINLTSPLQVKDLLFNKLGLKTNRYTKSTKNTKNPQMAADATVLSTLAESMPVLKRVINWREMKTLLTRYLVNYENDFNYATEESLVSPGGHLHPDLFAAGTVTGRFSAAHPNYQQLPKRYYFKLTQAKEIDKAHIAAHGDRDFPEHLRKKPIEDKCKCGEFEYPEGSVFDFNFRLAIIAPEGYKIFGFDLSQAELRVIAAEAGEPAMIDAFRRGEDVHLKTAALMTGKATEDVTKDERGDFGKMPNFAICYQLSAKSLGEKIGISEEEGIKIFAKYQEIYPNIAVWQSQQIKKVKQGFVYSRFGRRIPLWDLLSKERWIRSKADRVAVNGPIQGGATGDFVKETMSMIHEALWDSEFRDSVHMVMNIHDALEFYVKDEVDINEVYALIGPIVERSLAAVAPTWLPFVADWHVGKRWASVEELKVVDGKLLSKSDKTVSVKTEPVVSEVDTVPAVLTPEPPTEVQSRTVVIHLSGMPEEQIWEDFKCLLKDTPGVNKIRLVVPEGNVDLPVTTRLCPSDQGIISSTLNGARVTYLADAVDKDDLLARIGLA